MADVNQIILEADGKSVLALLKNLNAEVSGFEKNATGANQKWGESFEKISTFVVRSIDKQHAASEKLVQSLERQATVAGRSGVEKLIAQRDAHIKRLAMKKH
jgi:hypothetical protein